MVHGSACWNLLKSFIPLPPRMPTHAILCGGYTLLHMCSVARPHNIPSAHVRASTQTLILHPCTCSWWLQGSEHAINFENGEDSRERRNELRGAIQRALSEAATQSQHESRGTSRGPSRMQSRSGSPIGARSPLQQPEQCEVSRKITTTGIHLGERVMLIETSQFDFQRGTLR